MPRSPEDLPLLEEPQDLPYVIKSPWLTECIDQILARDDIVIDGVIIPIRDLVEAATSRTVVEMQQRYARLPSMARLDQSWENWGITPGGTVFSLSPIDQARLLAVSFHRLVRHLTEAEVPTVFVAFPRITGDAEYLFEKLKPFLPTGTALEQAREAHRCVAKSGQVRIGAELGGDTGPPALGFGASGFNYPAHEQADSVALRREVQRLQQETAELKAQTQKLIREREGALEQLSQHIARSRDKIEQQKQKTNAPKASLRNMKRSRSWRLTEPLRQMSEWLRPNAGRPGRKGKPRQP